MIRIIDVPEQKNKPGPPRPRSGRGATPIPQMTKSPQTRPGLRHRTCQATSHHISIAGYYVWKRLTIGSLHMMNGLQQPELTTDILVCREFFHFHWAPSTTWKNTSPWLNPYWVIWEGHLGRTISFLFRSSNRVLNIVTYSSIWWKDPNESETNQEFSCKTLRVIAIFQFSPCFLCFINIFYMDDFPFTWAALCPSPFIALF